VLFGAAHSSIYRFVPTGLLGMLLTAIVLRGRSLFPAILLHAAYNSMVLFDVDVPALSWLAIPGVFLLLRRGPAEPSRA
jgi:membrane protease YdiL (CAAX protease family)